MGSIKVVDSFQYLAHLPLGSSWLPADGREETLSPGMAMTAEIKTRRRYAMSYLLSPRQRYAREGGRAR